MCAYGVDTYVVSANSKHVYVRRITGYDIHMYCTMYETHEYGVRHMYMRIGYDVNA
jgi:hypothetical protein